tara:strand:- start:334 stop:690 length:357 start_codon:yes stop_codon:yes gene_type:complete
MKLSSPRFKAIAVTAGFSFWFIIITTSIGVFSFESFGIFLAIIIAITQIFSVKLSKGLDAFAIINTKIFLGILYIFLISIYGILFRLLAIDLLRTKWKTETYWIKIEQIKDERVLKQY